MKKQKLSLQLAAILPLAYGIAVQAEPAQVLFSSAQLKVIDAQGVERMVKQGDFINPGERVITADGVLGQLKLPDGTLISTRPDSDVRLEKIEVGSGKNVLGLIQGNVRVINMDLPNRPKPLPVDVITPSSTLQITAGDGESFLVKPTTAKTIESGTYNRLQLGAAIIRNAGGELPLKPLDSGFVQRPDTLPTGIASLPTTLARPTSLTIAPTTITPVTTGTATSTALSGIESLTTTTSILTAPTLTAGTTTTSISPVATTTIVPTTALSSISPTTVTPVTTTPTQPIASVPISTPIALAPTPTITTQPIALQQPIVLPQTLSTTVLRTLRR